MSAASMRRPSTNLTLHRSTGSSLRPPSASSIITIYTYRSCHPKHALRLCSANKMRKLQIIRSRSRPPSSRRFRITIRCKSPTLRATILPSLQPQLMHSIPSQTGLKLRHRLLSCPNCRPCKKSVKFTHRTSHSARCSHKCIRAYLR